MHNRLLNIVRNYLYAQSFRRFVSVEIVECNQEGHSYYVYNAIHLSVIKGKLSIGEKVAGTNIDGLKDFLNEKARNKLPIIAIVNGDKIFSTYSEVPNLNSDVQKNENVYSQEFKLGNGYWVTGIRKETLCDMLRELNVTRDRIVHVEVGLYPLLAMHKLFHGPVISTDTIVKFCNYRFVFRENELVDYEVEKHCQAQDRVRLINVGDERLDERLVAVYANALFALLNNRAQKCLIPEYEHNFNDFLFRREVAILSKYSAIALFILLLVSNIVYSFYAGKLSKAESESGQMTTVLSRYDVYNQKFAVAKETLQKEGILQSKIAYYSDQLTRVLPEDLYCSEIHINPVMSVNNATPVFDSSVLVVKGYAVSEFEVNNWLAQIKKYDWIAQARIDRVTQNKDDGLKYFEVTIQKYR